VKHAKRIGRQRQRRSWRVSNKVQAHSTRPRLAVFRSHQHIYAQVIDDERGHTVAAASSLEPEVRKQLTGKTKTAQAELVGTTLAERAKAAGITAVVFDRGGFRYHGRVKAVADGARSGGLQF